MFVPGVRRYELVEFNHLRFCYTLGKPHPMVTNYLVNGMILQVMFDEGSSQLPGQVPTSTVLKPTQIFVSWESKVPHPKATPPINSRPY